MTFDFSGQVAMITGASGNLGAAAAQAFRAAGAKLALVDRHEEVLITLFPDLVGDSDCFISGCADLTKPDDVSPVVQAAMEHFGRIDILANTVGGYRAGTPIHETSLDTWDHMAVCKRPGRPPCDRQIQQTASEEYTTSFSNVA